MPDERKEDYICSAKRLLPLIQAHAQKAVEEERKQIGEWLENRKDTSNSLCEVKTYEIESLKQGKGDTDG